MKNLSIITDKGLKKLLHIAACSCVVRLPSCLILIAQAFHYTFLIALKGKNNPCKLPPL